MTKLFKTTIVILSEYDPTFLVEIDDLARDAMSGEAYCIGQSTEEVDCEDLEEGPRDFFSCGDSKESEDE